MFFVLEGIDGCGKSTQARLLVEHLRKEKRKEALLVREPGGTELGERLRGLILDPGGEPLEPATEMFLFLAARSHLVSRKIRPALRDGHVVVSDRFYWSTVVYQGLAAGQDHRLILRLSRWATSGVRIARTFLIDVDPEVAYRRVRAPNRMEKKGLEFQQRVRRGFLELAKRRGNAITVIDGRGTVAEIQARIRAHLPQRGWSRCSSR